MENIKLLFYCTITRKRLFFDKLKQIFTLGLKKSKNDLNGKIVAECDFEVKYFSYRLFECLTHNYLDLLKKSCLNDEEMYDYLNGNDGYAIHIKNLHIFDKPKELKNNGYKVRDRKNDKETQIFKVDEWQPIAFKYIEKAPQNMCKVYRLNNNEEEYDEYILISIRPEWLCKILNGEKTIEIRKRILREMIL